MVCPEVRPEGWLRWFAHLLGGGVCRGHEHTLLLLPAPWLLKSGSWVFLVSFYVLSRICPNCAYMQLLLLPFSFFVGLKNPSANAGDTGDMGLTLGSGRSLEKEMATHSSILAWEITWTEVPRGLQSRGLQNNRI